MESTENEICQYPPNNMQLSTVCLSLCFQILEEALKICNYIFTIIFVMESVFKLIAFGFRRFFQDR